MASTSMGSSSSDDGPGFEAGTTAFGATFPRNAKGDPPEEGVCSACGDTSPASRSGVAVSMERGRRREAIVMARQGELPRQRGVHGTEAG